VNYKKVVGLLEEIRRGLQAEAEQHHPGERCKDGTHWNEDHNKCEPLSSDLHAAHKHAWDRTVGARNSSNYADSKSLHPSDAEALHGKALPDFMAKAHAQAAVANSHAAHAHEKAAGLTHAAGFHELAKQHNMLAGDHHRNYATHSNKWHTTPEALDAAKAKNPLPRD
jgi:outer membrane receptor for ferric coprogen and ferric-rhodotorulic acid